MLALDKGIFGYTVPIITPPGRSATEASLSTTSQKGLNVEVILIFGSLQHEGIFCQAGRLTGGQDFISKNL